MFCCLEDSIQQAKVGEVEETPLAVMLDRPRHRLPTVHNASLVSLCCLLLRFQWRSSDVLWSRSRAVPLERENTAQRDAIEVAQVVVEAVVHAAQLVRFGDDLFYIVDRRAVLFGVEYDRGEALFGALRCHRSFSPRCRILHSYYLGRLVLLYALLFNMNVY